jgi:hypothetical protein
MGFPPIEYEEEKIVFFKGSALDYLQSIYRDPTEERFVRMRAAIAAIPFESPKLQATATLQLGLDFAAKLDRAFKRSGTVKLVANAPVQPPREKPKPTVEITPYRPTVPDRRYRRF